MLITLLLILDEYIFFPMEIPIFKEVIFIEVFFFQNIFQYILTTLNITAVQNLFA